MRILCAFGRHAYGDPARGEGYEHANFLPALRALGHEVELFDSFDRTAHADFAALNRAFLRRVEAFRPQIVFCVLMHYELWSETLQAARGCAAVINWGTDDSWKFAQFTRHVAPHLDLYVTTYPSALQAAREAGLSNVVLSAWAANAAALAEPLPAADCRHPVSFVGAAYGNRRRWIEALRARGIEVACRGHGWPGGAVSGTEAARMVRESVISLNFADSGLHWSGLRPYRSRQVKARTFEVPGGGGFLLTEDAPGLDRYYVPGEEVALFRSPDHAAQEIRRYLAQPALRDRIARAGHARTVREHTYERRFAPLIDQVAGVARARACPDWLADRAAFERLAAAHAAGGGLRAARVLLSAPAQLLFGKRRGARAARRLVFEISWRLAGAHTYSHRGWPGRMFYRES